MSPRFWLWMAVQDLRRVDSSSASRLKPTAGCSEKLQSFV